jgi:tRNA G18 (ribose-2'-O)-methylase SpoU
VPAAQAAAARTAAGGAEVVPVAHVRDAIDHLA